MSGLFSQLLGGQQSGHASVLNLVQQVLAENGGVSGLISRFQSSGLGEQAQSWVSQGQNQPITPDHVDQVFSQDEIARWAQQAGSTPDAIKSVLAEAVPHLVDHATPNGQAPATNETPDLAGLVSRFLGSR